METKKKIIWAVVLVVLVVVVLGIAAVVYKAVDSKLEIKRFARSEYQAVFLTNGQVYFGKLSKSDDWYTISEVYYLQVTDGLQAGETQDPNQQVGLVKLGSELHGPEDTMYVAPDHVLFWENLKSDSQVVQKIKQSPNQ